MIVPARSESAVISDCLNSLARQTYDPHCFDTYVVVADEADPTVAIAAACERTQVMVVSGQACKGDALDGVLKRILAESPDAYTAFLILDADNLAAPDLLEEMNNALASGRQIICGKKLIKNWQSCRRESQSFISNCTALTYTQVDELGNRARNTLSITITMIGTGMLVRSDVIKENKGWPYRGLTEDYEMTADAIIKGWTSLYYSHARVYTEEATDAKTAFKRKMRWIKGYTQCQRRYHKAINKMTFSRPVAWRNLDFMYSTYPAYVFFGVSAVASLFGMVALGSAFFAHQVNLVMALRLTLIPLAFIYGVLFVFTLVTLAADWSSVKIPLHKKLTVLFANPLYMLGYFRIFITAFVTGNDYFSWEVADRVPFEAPEGSEWA
ncbi:MAG: glycosyltransferase family 2 protein [Coriobacteriia bacterium]|nr:glycosyltransferase family 2 protein [Coriobacteriia bacterium]